MLDWDDWFNHRRLLEGLDWLQRSSKRRIIANRASQSSRPDSTGMVSGFSCTVHFLVGATVVIGSIGTAFTVVPFIVSWQPSARPRAAGAPVKADDSKLEPGQQPTVEGRSRVI